MSLKNSIFDENWNISAESACTSKDSSWTKEIIDLFDKESGRFIDGWDLVNIEYINPSSTENINPTVKLWLSFGDEEIGLIFLYVIDEAMILKEQLDEYCCHLEEVQQSVLIREEGHIVFACEFTSGLRLYIKSEGITVDRISMKIDD